MNDQRTVLVTGGAGYIGTCLCTQLVAKGYNVISVDRVKRKKEIEGVVDYPFDLDNHQVKGLINLLRPEIVIHLAADNRVSPSVRDPGRYYWNNVANSISLLNESAENGVKQFIFASSSSVYGTNRAPFKENTMVAPISPYAKTKAMVESAMEDYAAATDMKFASLRLFNVAGADIVHAGDVPIAVLGYPYEESTHIIPHFAKCAVDGTKFPIYGNEFNVRDFTFICDAGNAFIKTIEYLDKDTSAAYNVFNISGGTKGTTVLDIAEKFLSLVDKDLNVNDMIEYLGSRPGDIPVSVGDNSLAKQKLGWEPTKNIDQIVLHSYIWEVQKHKKGKK